MGINDTSDASLVRHSMRLERQIGRLSDYRVTNTIVQCDDCVCLIIWSD